ncbi:hypothetical protein JTE90_011672 [Oedothorax gibbosus]|uniref:NADPH-dependent diflavin oxidoreductase 1 n=1 Tax=Oedothorax gibbosus TaxID=931172 RepID=A0AAV6UUV8_9ARAC|nr:hypothetical protein JTE90_011672 [Oedothorax gibbosus]
MLDSSKRVVIVYGTQTGNSEDVSERVGRLVKRMKCHAFVSSLSDFPIARMAEETLIIFVCSTTGNGEFPDGMRNFWKFLLRKNLPRNSLCHLKFCVFGLGDSSYDKFNVVAKKLNKRLMQLGAIELIPLALADDQHELGYDAALDPWMMELRGTLKEYFQLSEDSYMPDDVPLPPKYTVTFTQHDSTDDFHVKGHHSSIATLKTNHRVTAKDHFQAVHLLEFDIDAGIHYDPGDVAVVCPENSVEDVEDFLALLNIPVDGPIVLTASNPEVCVPKKTPCTVRQYATSYFDFKSIPRRSFFEFFHHFSHDETEKEKLLEFTTAAGQEELYDYCNRPRRNILEVLKDFPHTTPHVPFEYLFDMIPSIRPRSFSIASSLSAHPQQFHLLVAVVKYKTRLINPRKGLCSTWVTGLSPGDKIPFSIKRGSISLPQSNAPIIMIGPGTGCAPFRSFSEERSVQNIPDNYLFLGFRNKEKDFLFSETWMELERKVMLRYFTAFSRDQEDKVYVQHRVAQNGPLLWQLINDRQAAVYVAGNAKQMPQGVKEAFLEMFQEDGGLDTDASAQYLQMMENQKRYQVETWA